MPAKIIPFPRFMQRHFTLNRVGYAAGAPEHSCEGNRAGAIHLVDTPQAEDSRVFRVNAELRRESQQEAFRIVQEVQKEWNDRHHEAHVARGERRDGFWDTLPMPQPQRETPLTIARRLMHLLLSDARTA